MSKRLLVLAMLALFSMFVMAGCSGDDGKDADTGAIIETLNERIAELQAQLEESLGVELRAQLEAEIAELQRQLDEARGVVTGVVTSGPADDLQYSNYDVAVDGNDVVITFNVTYVANGRGFADYTGLNAVYNARQFREGETSSYAYERNRMTSGMALTLLNASTGLYEVRFADAATSTNASIADLYNMASGVLPFDSDMLVTFTYGNAGLATSEDPYRKRYLVIHSQQGEGLGRNLVSNQACYNCHADEIFNRGNDTALELVEAQDNVTSSLRRGYHYATAPGDVVDSCVTCHGYNGNLARYAHSIHASNNSSIGNGEIEIKAGYTYGISYPNTLSNCAACHDTEEGRTITNDENFTFVNCVSCHGGAITATASNLDDWTDGWAWTVPAIKDMHEPYGAATVCSQCHTDAGIGRSFAEMHSGWEPASYEAQKYAWVIDSVNLTPNAGAVDVEVVWSVEKDGTPITLNIAAASATFEAPRLAPSVSIVTGYGKAANLAAGGFDWTNEGNNRSYITAASTTYNTANTVGTSTYTISADSITAGVNVAGLLFSGRPQYVNDSGGNSYIPFSNLLSAYQISDAEPVVRRSTTEDAKCVSCHGSLYFHGGSRIIGPRSEAAYAELPDAGVQGCIACHNPSTTDKVGRNATGTTAANAIDGKDEESFDFKILLHRIHGAGEGELYGLYRSNSNVYAWRGQTTPAPDSSIVPDSRSYVVTYPQPMANCEACHNIAALESVALDSTIPFTKGAGLDLTTRADDTVVGPYQAACASCHLEGHATAHFTTMGGADVDNFDKYTQNLTESCATCHGGSTFGHGIKK